MLKKLFAGLTVFTLAAIVGVSLGRAGDGEALGFQKISNLEGGFGATIDNGDALGASVTGLGDLNADGVPEIAVGVPGDDDGGAFSGRGAVYILFLANDGTLDGASGVSGTGYTKIADDSGDLPASVLADGDAFGSGLASLGDFNSDGIPELAVGAPGDDAGGSGRGAIYILFLDANGSIDGTSGVSTDGYTKIADGLGDLPADVLANGDGFGTNLGSAGDLNDDDRLELAVGVQYDSVAGFYRGAVYILFLDANGSLNATAGFSTDGYTKIADSTGGFPALEDLDNFGTSVVSIGDINGDGMPELAVGAEGDDDGGSGRGAVYILFLNANGTLDGASGVSTDGWTKISDDAPSFSATIADSDYFGSSVALIGDLNSDDIAEIAVGARGDVGEGSARGAAYVLFLAADGTLDGASGASGDGYSKISDTAGYFEATLDNGDSFGMDLSFVGDVDGDDIPDLIAGMREDDDGGNSRGAVYVVFLDGTLAATSTPTSPNPPSAFTFGIADTGTCTWDPNVYLSVRGSNLAQVIVSDNLRFVGAQVLPYTPNNGSTVLPDHLSPVDNTMYIAFKLPSYATSVNPATGEQIEVPLYGPYSVYAVGRSGSGNITSIQTDSITFASTEDCTYPYEVVLEEDTGNGSEEGNEGGEGEEGPVDPLIPVERHQIISLSANMNDLTNEFYLVDTAADGTLVKRPDPRVTNYDISFSWLNKGYPFLSVNQRTLDSLPTTHAMLPEGPAILKFTEGSQNYFYIPSDNSAPREITTANLANELFLGTPWTQSLWILGPEVPSSSVPHGRTIPRYDVAIVRDWRNNR